jgi:transcriptional adapter 2-alpha
MGLLSKPKTISKANLYQTLLQSGPGYSQLLKYGQLMCAFDFDYVLEGLQHEMSLRQQILHLQEYRQNGLTKFLSTAFYSKLRQQREKHLREVSGDTVLDWTQSRRSVSYVQDKATGKIVPTTNRRSALPLDIVGMPGYERLTAEERELCSEVRVFPEMFLEIRQIMVSECQKNNGLRLADARPVVKIDVNKTRKLYDYFVETGDIFKPA